MTIPNQFLERKQLLVHRTTFRRSSIISSILILSIALGLSISSCKRYTSPLDSVRPAKGNRTYGGIYRYNESGELRSLDPVQVNDVTSAHITENIYDQLMYFDEKLNLTYELAERREINSSATIYTYYIRKGVYFHDNPCFANGKGRELTAYDVEYTFKRVCDARSGTLGSEYFRGKVMGASEYFDATLQYQKNDKVKIPETIPGFKALDRYTFQIQLVKPFAPFEYYVAQNNTGVHPHEAVEYYGKDFRVNPVGSGAFIFKKWSQDQYCELVRNPHYWKVDSFGNRLPYLDGVTTSFIKDDKVQLLEFKEGNLEESYRIPSEFYPQIVDTNKQLTPLYSKYVLHRVPALSTQYYGMLTIHPVFRDKRVRQAFVYAVDRNRIIRYVLKGQAGEPGHHGLVPPTMPQYPFNSIRGYEFNPIKARELMRLAGYPDGRNFPKITLQLNAGGGRNSLVAEAIQQMLTENLGINIAIKTIEFARHLDDIDYARSEFFRLGWVADYPDPETFLNLYYGRHVPASTSEPSPQNTTRYRNPVFDSLFDEALSKPLINDRNTLFAKAEQVAVNDAPMLYVFHDEDYRLVQSYVKGFRSNSMDKRPYQYVWFSK
jgi:oligopeptide transport system substrate-binding protein